MSDASGKVVWSATFDPWGRLLDEFNPEGIDQPIRFQGQFFDPESGLHYNRHRFYDPNIGSYINQDPIGLMGGVNLYKYPINPNAAIDPLGLNETLDHIFNIGPIDAINTNSDTQDALKTAEQSGLPGLHNGQADGFRHCYWSCIMAIRMGVEQAKLVGDTHEEYGTKNGQPKMEETMDLHNNSIGRTCSRSAKNKRDCEKQCKDKVKDGDIWWIEKGKLTTSNDWMIP